jgi:hypothetical protein
MIESPALLQEIHVPRDYQIVAPIIIGYPAKIPVKTARAEPIIL